LVFSDDPGGRREPNFGSIVVTQDQASVKTRFCVEDHTLNVAIERSYFLWDRPLSPAAATKKQKREVAMNHSMYSADRATHLKIVVIGLVCATVVAVVGIFANVSSGIDLGTAALVKAGEPTTMSGQVPTVR
jgi:hypothetical protein